jgi:AraC-like DNA-binding protein
VNSIPLTKSRQFWPLTDYLGELGVPIGRYIERYRIPKGMFDAPELYIDESRFWRLAGDLAEREGLLDWGFRAGRQLDLSVLGEFGDTLLRQPSLKTALDRFLVTIRAEALHVAFELMPQGEYFWLLQRGFRNAPGGRSVVELYDLQFMIKLVQSSVGDRWRPSAVHLQCDALPEGMAASEICAGDIRFSSTMTAIAIPRALMVTPMSDYQAFPVARDIIACSERTPIDFATSLRLLLSGYMDQRLTIGDCADLVGMSDRTLQRRLAEHQTSFNEILDQTRFDMARQLLLDNSMSFSAIAYELGYANPANFTRAFRRWAGISPRQHRQSLNQ